MQSDFTGKRVTVVGFGRSGIASARLLDDCGAYLTVTDEQPASALPVPRKELAQHVRRRFGGFHREDFLQADLIIVSPGVRYDHPYLLQARAAGIPTLSELELAYTQAQKPIVAITGTNGKTTVTSWIGALLKASGREVSVCGNIGYPFSAAIAENAGVAWYVVEVSSFQLEGIERFRPDIGVILNVTPDHLDRHGGIDRYRDLKLRLAGNQQPADSLIINADDAQLVDAEFPGDAELYFTSRHLEVERGASLHAGSITLRLSGAARVVGPSSLLKLDSVHNEENMLAAVLAAALAGAPDASLAATLPRLASLPHRLEFVGEARGARVFNDSKATNLGAVRKALENFSDGVILLLGGQNKGIDFAPLAETIGAKVRLLVLFGAAKDELAAALAGAAETVQAATLAGAVQIAIEHAAPGRVVLLSPGCTSFDEFANYEERGERFKTLVRTSLA